MGVENKGIEEEIEKWSKFPEVFGEEIEKEAKKLGRKWLTRLREETPRGKTGQLRPGWKAKIERGPRAIQIIAYNNVHYAAHWNYGHRVKVHGKFTGHTVPGTYAAEETRRRIYKELPGALKSAMQRTERRIEK